MISGLDSSGTQLTDILMNKEDNQMGKAHKDYLRISNFDFHYFLLGVRNAMLQNRPIDISV